MRRISRTRCLTATLFLLGAAVAAEAGTIKLDGIGPDGRSVSAEIEWSYDTSGDLCIWLTNHTLVANTRSAGELLTGVSFSVGSISSGTSLDAATAAQIYDASKTRGKVVATSGATNVNLLDVDPSTSGNQDEWRFSHLSSGLLDLTWNGGSGPDYGIIGSYNNDTDKEWTNANGGISNATSHHPFVYETAFFKLSNSSFGRQDISNATFYFGTGPTAMRVVPLPAAAWMGLALLAGIGLRRRLRRRASATL